MALTAAERAKRYRDGHKSVTEQRHVTEAVTTEQHDIINPVELLGPATRQRVRDGLAAAVLSRILPPLPADTLIHANADIGWADVMALERQVIDEVYHVATVMWLGQQEGCIEELLLRLVRAAGYASRRAA